MQKLLSNPLEYNSVTRISSYNCYGFACQTFEWGELAPYSEADEDYDGEIDGDLIVDLCADDIVKYSQNTDGPLIRVDSLDEVPIGIEVVGFRIGIQEEEVENCVELENGGYEWVLTGEYRTILDDFHFIWRDVNGKWWHKPGGCPIEPFKRDPEGEDWGRYNSKIAWFARNPSDDVEGKWEAFESPWSSHDDYDYDEEEEENND